MNQLREVPRVHDRSLTDIAAVLRRIANAIEDGEYGPAEEVETAVVLLVADDLQIHSCGTRSDASHTLATLINGVNLFSRRISESEE